MTPVQHHPPPARQSAQSAFAHGPHLGALDGLRGIAVLLVVFSHTSNGLMHIVPGIDAGGMGKVGVWLFFVLSAFLLTGRLDHAARCGRWSAVFLGQYLIARIARIFPLYACVILATWWAGRMDGGSALRHLGLQEGVGIFWTIPVEFKYYLAMPVLVAVLHFALRDRFLLFLSLFVTALAVVAFVFPPMLTLVNDIGLGPYLVTFAVGSCAALWVDRGDRWERLPGWLAAAGLGVIVVTVPSLFNVVFGPWIGAPVAADAFHPFGPLYAVLWTLILLKGLTPGVWSKVLGAAPLRYVGRVSFSIYLLHIPIMEQVAGATEVPAGLRGTLVLGGVILAATVSYHLIERPGMHLGRRLGACIARPAANRVAAD